MEVLGTRSCSPVQDKPQVPYAEPEFDTATEAGLDRLLFLLDTDVEAIGIPASRLIDHEFGARQEAFCRCVRDSGLVTGSLASPAEPPLYTMCLRLFGAGGAQATGHFTAIRHQ